MKRVIMVLLLGAFAGVLTGCANNGVASGTGSSSTLTAGLTASDLSVVEASLITTSVLAADSAPTISASVLASDSSNPPPFPMKGREFRGRRAGGEWMVRRGEGGCELRLETPASMTPHLRIGSESCTLEKSADGKILITRSDGTILTINPASDGSTGEFTVDAVTWTYTWSETSVLTLKNSANGRILTITENTDGSLIIAPPGGHPHPARWGQDGALEGTFPAEGAGFRFRGGRFQE